MWCDEKWEDDINAILFAQNFKFDDNACPYRVQVINEILCENDIERMNWTATLSDMNVIEHVQSQIKPKLNESAQELPNFG